MVLYVKAIAKKTRFLSKGCKIVKGQEYDFVPSPNTPKMVPCSQEIVYVPNHILLSGLISRNDILRYVILYGNRHER